MVGFGALCLSCAEESALPTSPDEQSSVSPDTTSASAEVPPSATGAPPTGPGTTANVETLTTSSTATTNPSSANASTSSAAVEPVDSSAAVTTVANSNDTSVASTADVGSPQAVAALEEYLNTPQAQRPTLTSQDFAAAPLSAEQAAQAQALLWADHSARVQAERRSEHDARQITLGDFSLRYDFTVFGDPTATGRSLYLSLHGGGEADPSVNDEQWENQKQLYTPEEGIYLSPRAPTDTWNLWHQDHIDPLFGRLIENFIVLEGVDPNRVYVMGYSAGGDGVYQLGPRMADHWAAASAMAGHPNEAKPFSLRNIGFTIHVGAEDTAFDRNLVAVQWRDELDGLQADDPEGYPHVVEVHAGKPHWMDLEDAVAVPWMAEFTRNPTPDRIVWYQDDILHQRFYWLRATQPVKETTVRATLNEQTVTLESDDVAELAVRLRDEMLDLDQPITITANGRTVFEGVLNRTIATLHTTLFERGDPALVFSAEQVVSW